jgi:hypothetical protein
MGGIGIENGANHVFYASDLGIVGTSGATAFYNGWSQWEMIRISFVGGKV